MLKIENINKLIGRNIGNGYWGIYDIFEGTHNNTYIFKLDNKGASKECTIMLEREGYQNPHKSDEPLAYYFILDSKRTDVCVTAKWITNKDNMLSQLDYLIKNI